MWAAHRYWHHVVRVLHRRRRPVILGRSIVHRRATVHILVAHVGRVRLTGIYVWPADRLVLGVWVEVGTIDALSLRGWVVRTHVRRWIGTRGMFKEVWGRGLSLAV